MDFSKVLRELRRFNYLTFYCSKCHPCFCKFLCSSNYQGKEKESFWAHKHRSSQHLTVSFTELLQFALKAQKESMKYEFYFVAQLVSSSLRNIYCTLQYFFIHCEHFKTLLQMLFKKILPILTRAALVNQPLRMHRRFIFWSYIWVQGELWPWREFLIKYKKETKSLSKSLEKNFDEE